MSYLIELKDVTKRYGEIVALNNISLKVTKGEILAIIGPNGSGKTTLLRIMAGIDKPTSGEIYFDGAKIYDKNIDEVRSRSTMIFQRTVFFGTTVYKNLAYGLKLRGYSKKEIKEKVREALRIVKLEGYESRPAKRLSGGEQQRLSLARALILGTELILLDEPTANLDPYNVAMIEEIISEINRNFNTTIIMATHNMFQAKRLGKKVVFLFNGEVVEISKADKIFEDPQDKRTKSFIKGEMIY
ncbi:MAG: phosphate ABC transporter ATP-binding protein [archaeon]|nr:phosphate ABC transporter ATP-binding protein [archaeon]MCP8314791.1 phosphate ABC transporter ATP-binding protein [archaeon]MCP8315598.1 phosphate ABC transporter ATP-binding protein [archaeon]MCP8321280.1 phosphate ABC transporter ATP-binding protein [archaeon]